MLKNALFLLKNRRALGAEPPHPLPPVVGWASAPYPHWPPAAAQPPDTQISPLPMTKSWLRAWLYW